MKLCRIFNQYSLLVFFILLIYNCYGEEDSIIPKYSESTIIVDPFTQYTETANVHSVGIEKNNILSSSIQQHNDVEHIQKTLEARQDYINRLNQLLENDYDTGNEQDFQYLPSPLPLEVSDDVPSRNRTSEDAQVLVSVLNETTFSRLTSIQTQAEDQRQHDDDGLSSKELSSIVNHVQKSNEKTIQNEEGNNYQQICWGLPKSFKSIVELIANQVLHFVNLLPEFIEKMLFGRIDDREMAINTIWFGSICTMLLLFSLLFLSMGARRLKQNQFEKQTRRCCQQFQQYNDQIEFECATFERKNRKLSAEIDELKNLSVRHTDNMDELRKECRQLRVDLKAARAECDTLQQDIDHKHNIIQTHEYEMQKQLEMLTHLNDEILHQNQELEKEREIIARLQSNDLSLERFEKLRENIHELKSEITQLKQEKFSQTDQLQELQERSNKLDVENNQLTIKMKQLNDLLSTVTENNIDNYQQLLSTIDNDVEKANQHMRDLHSEIDKKTRRIKDLDSLLNQEKYRCKEIETKLKVVLELRERDAHLHIRQVGQTDAELRKAGTDTERIRILQQQLDLKQQQLDDVQKVLASEQTKFSEELGKLQHETHEKWMEVKRLTRELDGSKKECESLRRQITKYANSDRSSQEKAMLKPVPHHFNNTGGVSSDPATNGNSSLPPLLNNQEEKFIDQSSDSNTTSPIDMFRIRPPLFVFPRPMFCPPPFMPPPASNRVRLSPRFPLPFNGPQRTISKDEFLSTNKNKP